MSLITVSRLIACGIAATQANTFAEPLGIACDRFDINTPPRLAAFIGQCMVESDLLTKTEEDLFYRDPAHIVEVYPSHFRTAAEASPYAKNPVRLGARVYAGLRGNGDEASGDGYTFRGRGLLQITGRERYADAANGLAHSYLTCPNLVALPADACLTASWFWNCNKLNVLADAGAVDEITRAVNGRGMRQAALRKQYTQHALEALAA
jgi:putative chitinase